MATSSQPPSSAPATASNAASPGPGNQGINPLGFQQDSLAGLTVDDLLRNRTGLTMLLHSYHRLLDENGALRNDLNTAGTYVNGYGRSKVRTGIGAVLQALAAVPIGFAINILTGGNDALSNAGWTLLVIGSVLQIYGLVLAFWGEA